MHDKVVNTTIYLGAIIGFVDINVLCSIIGVGIALAAFIYNIYHKRQIIAILKQKNSISITDD